MNSTELSRRLDQLADEYTYRVNALVGDDREDLAIVLSQHYTEDRDEIMRELA